MTGKKDFEGVMSRFVLKYLLRPECGLNGVAETRLECMKVEGRCFRLRKGESLRDKCMSVSLVREPPADAELEEVFEGVRVFYHICNDKVRYQVYVP